jgi:hypothetical protein
MSSFSVLLHVLHHLGCQISAGRQLAQSMSRIVDGWVDGFTENKPVVLPTKHTGTGIVNTTPPNKVTNLINHYMQ